MASSTHHVRHTMLAAFAMLALLVAAALTLLAPKPASGASVTPTVVAGNPSCASLGYDFGLKVDPPASGTYALPGGLGDITVTVSGSSFSWESDIGIDAVIVKGGPNANVYRYDPPAEAFSDTNLTSPINPNNGRPFGLSHIEFCYDLEPGVAVVKSGDELSKVGDSVTYDFAVENTGDFVLYLDSITDTVLGDLAAAAIAAGCDVLDIGETCTFSVEYTIPAGAPDPLPNTVTVDYNTEEDLTGTSVTDTDDHSVNLFQPSITFDKTGDTLSKVGDPVDYTLTLNNTGSTDSPALDCTISDPLLGIDETVTLASGESHVINASRDVAAGDSDPLVNTAEVSCQVQGFPNILTDSDDHSVNLFQPAVVVDKSGDDLSKAGDSVTYDFEITNISSEDSPNLVLVSVSDTLLGDLTAAAIAAGCDELAVGESCSFSATRTVLATDPDPLINTVSVLYNPAGFPNEITDSDDHEVNLFQPSVQVDKQGDSLSKVGDTVTYNFKVTNTSSADSPNLILDSADDTLLGDLTDEAIAAGCDVLAPGDTCEFNVERVVQAGDTDPLPNEVTFYYHPDGFPNVISDNGTHEVNLFQPGVAVDKSGDTLSKAGDVVTYTFTITNTGSADSPNLVLDSVVDDVLGDLTAAAAAAGCGELASGTSCTFTATRTVLDTDPDPLTNTVTVHYHPAGFPNDISDSDSHDVDLVHPDYTLVKECGPSPARVGDIVTYTFTITNTGDVTLNPISVVDTLLGDITANFPSLAPGGSDVIELTRAIQPGDPDPLPNTVTAIYQVEGLPNQLTRTASCEVDIEQEFEGCTPGFWKNNLDKHNASAWPVDPNSPVPFGDGRTWAEAINSTGQEIIYAHTAAALLNLYSGFNFQYTEAEIIALFNAGDIDALAAANEAGCPIDQN